MASVINAVSGSGITQTADSSGVLKIQSNSVTTNALAWVNFNGTGTVAINSSYNVSSITDNGTGDYTINFATALTDANYSITGTATGSSYGSVGRILSVYAAPTTTAVRVNVTTCTTNANIDSISTNVAIFGN